MCKFILRQIKIEPKQENVEINLSRANLRPSARANYSDLLLRQKSLGSAKKRIIHTIAD